MKHLAIFWIGLLLMSGCAVKSEIELSEIVNESSEEILIESIEEESVLEEIKEKKKIYVDAGHGGSDSGAIWQQINEKDINLAIVIKLVHYLERDFDVVLSRDSDIARDLLDKAEEANELQVDCYVAVHQNTHTNSQAHGIEVWFSESKGEVDKRLAELLERSVIDKTGAKERGIWNSDTLVCLNKTNMPAALIETGFISNTTERLNLLNEDYQDQLAYGIYLGLVEYFSEVIE